MTLLSPNGSIAPEIYERIRQTRQFLYSTEAKAKAFSLGTLVFASTGICAFLELLLHFDATVRTTSIFVIAAAFVVGVSWYVLLPMLRLAGVLSVDNDFSMAKRIGQFFPSIQDGLTNFLELQREATSGASFYSVELLDASFSDFANTARPIDFNKAIDVSNVARMRKWFVGSAVSTTLLFAVFPTSMPDALFRLAHFNTEFTTPPKYSFEVRPGNKEIVKGEPVPISVRLSSGEKYSFQPRTLGLFYRMERQDRFDEMPMKQDSAGKYSAVLQDVKYSTEYFVRAADVQSQSYLLKVLDRPIIRSFRIRLEFPAYSRLPERIQDDFAGDVSALAGTRIVLGGSANKELADADIVLGRDSSARLMATGNKFSGSFRLNEDGNYYIALKDLDSLGNIDPVHYNLKVIPDAWPTVAIVSPGKNLDIVGDQSLQLLIHAEDDFGFTGLRLGYRMIHSRFQESQQQYAYVTIPLPKNLQMQVDVPYQWDLSKLDLVPEDVVEYFAEISDNDAIRGPKSSKSALYLLRLPSLQEVFSDVDKGHEQTLEDIKQAKENAKQLRDEVESINNDIKKNKDIDWQQQKKAEEITKKYQEIQKKLQNAQRQLDDMVQKMDKQNVLSKETMEKYMELQELFQELNSSELQQALKQMQQAMQNVNKEQLQQAMRQVNFSEERFRQGIERTLELLKRIQIEQKIDEVKKRAQEMEQMQKQLSNDVSKASNDNDRQLENAAKQEDLAHKEQEMEQASKDLAKRMEEFFTEMPLDKLNAMNNQLQKQNLSQLMKNAGEQIRQGNVQQAQQTQQQTQESLNSFSEQMDALQREMLQQQAQHVLNEMRKATNNMLTLSKREEALKDQAKDAAPNSSQLRQNAEDQLQAMQDLNNVTNGLDELSKRSFAVTPAMGKAIGEAMARMQDALRQLDIRNGQSASQVQALAMASLNEGAVQIQNAMQAMMQGSQGGLGGLMQQLQMLAGSQMALNLQSEKLGQGMSMQQAAEAARLAQGQEAIRKSLDQLNQEAKQSQEQQRLLGDLDKISEEMREVVSNLEKNNVSRETIEKQQRILSRLLDASKSMHERDYEKKRTSKTGTQMVRKSPDELNPEDLNATSKLREDLLRALQQGYSKDYQELIRKYFQELQKAEAVAH